MKKKIKLPKDKDYARVLLLRTFGNFLVLSALFLIAKTFYLPVREEIRYFIDSTVQKHYIVAGDKQAVSNAPSTVVAGGLAKLLQANTTEILVPQDPQFDIIIPKVGANSRIIPNVNPADETEYLEALKHGVAHTLGTAFPGENGHIFLFAHSTDYFWNVGTYNAVFYLLYKLQKGDEIDLFYKGQRYVYLMTGKETVDPSQVQYITRQTNTEFLTLQTCWPPGTTLQRLLVYAVRKAH